MQRPEIAAGGDLGIGVTRGRPGLVDRHGDEGVQIVVQPGDRIETVLDHLGDRGPASPDLRCAFDDTHMMVGHELTRSWHRPRTARRARTA